MRPMPGSANTCSMTTEPPIAVLSRMPVAVMIRIRALRKRVLADRAPFAEALGARRADEILAQHVEHRRARHARQEADLEQRQDQRRQDRPSENHGPIPCEIGAKPLDGTQPSMTLNRMMPRMAIQNAGIDTPSSAIVMTPESIQVCR